VSEQHDMSGVGWMFEDRTLETTQTLDDPRVMRAEHRNRVISAVKRERLESFYTSIPAQGEAVHVVSNGSFDYWLYCPVTLKHLNRPATHFYGSTWTMNRQNVLDLFELFDDGKIQAAAMLTGVYFKRRESAVANTLISGLEDRGQRYMSFRNHAKVMLIASPPDFVVIEGSANFTANPRLEQTVVVNDRALYDFHREWMEEMLSAK